MVEAVEMTVRPDIFLLVDLRDFFQILGSGGRKKNDKKSSENDQLTGHFQIFSIFFFIFRAFFFLF